jgi:hypothetical protein
LVAVNALVVGLVQSAGFFWIQREIAEALTGAHFPWAQDQVIWLHGADRAAVLGQGELDAVNGGSETSRSLHGWKDGKHIIEPNLRSEACPSKSQK